MAYLSGKLLKQFIGTLSQEQASIMGNALLGWNASWHRNLVAARRVLVGWNAHTELRLMLERS